jgi:hypothetical protein
MSWAGTTLFFAMFTKHRLSRVCRTLSLCSQQMSPQVVMVMSMVGSPCILATCQPTFSSPTHMLQTFCLILLETRGLDINTLVSYIPGRANLHLIKGKVSRETIHQWSQLTSRDTIPLNKDFIILF